MKVGRISPRGSLILFALFPVLLGTGCKSNNQASAQLPPAASPSLYPSSSSGLQAAPANPHDSIFANQEAAEPLPAPDKPKVMPFKLRTGETLASYKVQKGDNLGKIAKRYGTSVSRIKSANSLSSDTIYAGKSYKIPTKKSEAEIAAASSSSSTPSRTITASAPSITKPTAPPAPPSYGSTSSYGQSSSSQVISSSPSRTASSAGLYRSSSSGGYTPPSQRSYSPPPSSKPPTFAPRTFDYNGPSISTPRTGGSSITIPTEEASGSGAAFPTPTFNSSTSF